jgi:hypothetical protein
MRMPFSAVLMIFLPCRESYPEKAAAYTEAPEE